MPARVRVAFARINRRNPDQQPLAPRTFREDMEVLGNSGRLRSQRGNRTFIAGDLAIVDDGTYMIGVLGHEVVEEVRAFDEAAGSWVKGATTVAEGALRDTTVPFAVDLRSDRRWVAFAPSSRIQPAGFAIAFQEVLNAAVRQLDLWPTDWEVDLVTSTSTIRAWVAQHPNVFKLSRTVRMTNPGLNLDDERERMQALGARVKEEEYRASRGSTLRVRDNPAFDEAIEGVERGDVDVRLTARGEGTTEDRFNSKKQPDSTYVDDFEGDLVRGMELVLDALRGYTNRRAGGPPAE